MSSTPHAVLITKKEHVQYLTGTTCEGIALQVQRTKHQGQGKLWFFTDARYVGRARAEVHKGVQVILLERPTDALKETITKLKIKKLGFEAEDISVARLQRLKKRFPAVTLVPTEGMIETRRRVKSPAEIRHIQKACAITVKVLKATLPFVQQSVTELALVEIVRQQALKFGAEGLAFDTIIAFGDNAAIPHAVPGRRKLKRGDLVLFDLGVRVSGYCSDMSRTFFTATPKADERVAYESTLQAQLDGVEHVRAGMACATVDAVVRSTLGAKLAPHFTHSTGHGVGLEIHESPSLSPISKDTLAVGNIVTVEPGVYLPGKFGIRIEDTVLVEKSGPKVLTTMPKQLTVLKV